MPAQIFNPLFINQKEVNMKHFKFPDELKRNDPGPGGEEGGDETATEGSEGTATAPGEEAATNDEE